MALVGNFGDLPLLSNLLGSTDTTLIDTGTILGEDDPRPDTALIDLDVDGGARPEMEVGAVSIGLLPELPNWQALIDADILSGSYGAGEAVVLDIGPDGFGPVLTGSLLADPANPIALNVADVPLTDILQGKGLDSLVGNVLDDVASLLPAENDQTDFPGHGDLPPGTSGLYGQAEMDHGLLGL